jgi:hypothetical protein
MWLLGQMGRREVGRLEVARGQSGFAESPINGSRRRFFLQMHLITQKIANKFKKSQKLNMTLDMLCISSKKLVVVKLKFKFL